MNKILMWIVIIVLVLGLGYFPIGNSDDSIKYADTQEGETATEIEESQYSEVETTDEILNEIDDSLNYFE